MDIFEAIRNDHQELRDLLEKLDRSCGSAAKIIDRQLNRLGEAIRSHHRAETAVFYPLLLEEIDYRESALKALEEHSLIVELLGRLEKTSREDERFKARLDVLGELLGRHMEQEEDELFDQAQEVVGLDEDEEIGRQYLVARQQAKKSRLAAQEEEEEEAMSLRDEDGEVEQEQEQYQHDED